MSRRRRIALVTVLSIAGTLGLAQAQKYTTGEEVMNAVDAKPTPSNLITTMTMTITTASGQSLTRQMQVWSADDGTKEVVKFTAPADIKGSGFLSTTLPDGSTQSMIYLPALDRTRRIAGGQKQESFFGSDFSYEDITDLQSGTSKKYDSKLLKTEAGPVYVVEATPKPGADTAYDKLVLQIPEATLIPTQIEFYRDGSLLKVMTIHKTVAVGGYTLPSDFEMKTVASGSTTTIQESDFQVQDAIPDEVFTERFLRR